MHLETTSAITNELVRLAKENDGLLTPSGVVQAAKSQNSPLHDCFDWSDTTAARKWRLHQARNLLRVCVYWDSDKEIPEPVKVFVSLTTDRQENTGYRVMTDVMNDDEYRRQLLEDALKDMERFQQKYNVLTELAEVFKAMRAIRKPVKVMVACKTK